MQVEFARTMYSDGTWSEWYALVSDSHKDNVIKMWEPGKVQFHTVEMPDAPKPVEKWKNDVDDLDVKNDAYRPFLCKRTTLVIGFNIGGHVVSVEQAERLRDWLSSALETETVYE